MSNHDIKLYNPLIVSSTQGILNTIEYLLFQISYFQKRQIQRSLRKKGTLSQNFGGEGGRRRLCPPPPLLRRACIMAVYYKMRQILLQNTTAILLQNMRRKFITKCDSYYKLRQYSLYSESKLSGSLFYSLTRVP